MNSPRKAAFRLPMSVLCAGLGLATLLAAQPASAQVMTYWGWGAPPPPWVRDQSPPRGFYRSFTSRQIADILYRHYGAQHVLLVRPAGDVFEADIIDRRGYRIRYTMARDTAEVLDRYALGSERYMAPAPMPPGMVPDRQVPREPRAVPQPPREARSAPAERIAPVRPQVQDTPSAPAPSVGPVERRPLPEPPVAAKPPEPAKPEPAKPSPLQPEPPRAVSPAPVAPPAAAKPEARPPARADSRAIQPPPRIPEPLTDPRTGRANPAAAPIPVAPLDDTPTRRVAPAPMVPPAGLE